MANKLTPIQTQFIKVLFGKALGNLKVAAKEIGIEDYSDIMSQELLDEIKKRGDQELAMSVPRAIHIMQRILDAPEDMFMLEKLQKTAADILDRAGLTRKDRQTSDTTVIGIVLLPNKTELPAPPENPELTIEAEFKQIV